MPPRVVALAVPLLLLAAPLAAQGPRVPTGPAVAPDTAAESRRRAVDSALAALGARGREPAEQVFEKIEVLKGMPAGRVLRIMDVAFGRSLGVGCAHCHVPGKWAAEDSTRKQVAREMWRLVQHVNAEHLARIEGLASDTARVNCTTCHRGATRPALDLEAAR